MNYIEPIVACFAAVVYLVLFIWVSNRLNKVEEKVFETDDDSFINSVVSKCLRASNLSLYKEGEEVWVDVAPSLKSPYGDYRAPMVTFSIIELLNKLKRDAVVEFRCAPSVGGIDRVTIVTNKGNNKNGGEE